MQKPNRRRPAVRFTLADRLLTSTQRLRADESATALTVRLGCAAKWIQATAGAR